MGQGSSYVVADGTRGPWILVPETEGQVVPADPGAPRVLTGNAEYTEGVQLAEREAEIANLRAMADACLAELLVLLDTVPHYPRGDLPDPEQWRGEEVGVDAIVLAMARMERIRAEVDADCGVGVGAEDVGLMFEEEEEEPVEDSGSTSS